MITFKPTRFWLILFAFVLPISLFAATPVTSIVILGDSLSDTGNTTHLLKSLRRDENPSYLVRPLKVFVINKMEDFANDYYVPQMVLDAGIEIVNNYFDNELGPMLANLVAKVKTVPVLPGAPYWHNRFSNGRVWNEYLAAMLLIDQEDDEVYLNQAFGGSWALTYDYQLSTWNLIRHPIDTIKALVVGKLIPPSLGLITQAHLLVNKQLDPKAVYFIFSGANDYLNMLRFTENYNSDTRSTYINNVLDAMGIVVHKLAQKGTRHIIVLGLPDISVTPMYNTTSTERAVLNETVLTHNERLQARMASWKESDPDVDFLYIDIETFLERALNAPEDYGFTNVTQACVDIKFPMLHSFNNSPFKNNSILRYTEVLNSMDPLFVRGETNYQVCDDAEHYLFWDEIHPSTRAHRFLAYDICLKMKEHGYTVSCQKPSNI